VTDIEVNRIAAFASSQLNGDKAVHGLTVLEASVQIVAGKNYFLTFSGLINNTQSVIEATIYQHLDGTLEIIQFEVVKNMHGGYEKIDPTSHELSVIAEFGWEHIAARYRAINIDHKKNSRILTASRQIVNGYNYKLLIDADIDDLHVYSFVTIYNPIHGDLSVIKYDVSINRRPALFVNNARSFAGGLRRVSPSRPDVVAAARFAAASLNGASVSDLEVLSARVQIVSGTNYFLTIRGTIGGEESVLELRVYKDLEKQYTLFNVNAVEENGECAGCARKITTEDEGVQEASRWAWVYLAKNIDGIDMEVGEMEIFDAGVQVVAGLNYFLTIHGTFPHQEVVAHVTVYKNLQGEYSLTDYSIEKDSQ